MSKVAFNSDFEIPTLLNEDIHILMEECGYVLLEQDHFIARYQNGLLRVVFNDNILLFQEKAPSGVYNSRFSLTSFHAMDDVSTMMLLESIGAIDFTKVPVYKEVFGASHKKTKLIPRRINVVDWFLKGLADVKALKQKSVGLQTHGGVVEEAVV